MKKRIVALFLSAFMVLSVAPVGAFALTQDTEERTLTMEVLPLTQRESTYRPQKSATGSEVTLTLDGEAIITKDAALFAAPVGVPQKLEDAMVKAAKSYTEKTDISALGLRVNKQITDNGKVEYIAPQFNRYCQAVIDKYPEIFNVKRFGCSFDTSTLKIHNLTLEFAYSEREYTEMMTQCNAVVDVLLSDLQNSEYTDLEKSLLLHDRIAVICEYDNENFQKFRQSGNKEDIPQDSYNMYGTLINRISVCQGYATSYRYMLNRLGIENYLCSSKNLNHVWNIIEIGGKYYHVDITWDDPTEDISGRVNHNNFLLSTDALKSESGEYNHNADDYDTDPKSTLYDDAFWKNYETSFQALDGVLYGIDSGHNKETDVYSGGVLTAWADTDEFKDGPKTIGSLPDQSWPAGSGSHWANSFSRLSADEDHLYYNTARNIYSYDPAKNIATPLYALDPNEYGGNFAIYGFKKFGNELVVEPNVSWEFTNRTKSLYGFTLRQGDALPFDENNITVAGLSDSYTYTGKTITPKLTVLSGSEVLTEGTDYTVSFSGNKNAGKATVVLSGKGSYEGKIEKSFKIAPAKISAAVISGIGDKTYTGKYLTVSPKLKFGGAYLKNGTDYTLSYKNNKYTGRASVTLTGKGNFFGSVTKYFYIHPAKVTGLKQTKGTASSITISWKKSASGTGYAVLRATSKNGKYTSVKMINTLKTTSFTDTGRAANKTYYYKVAAFKTVSGVRYTSPASAVLSVKTATKAPSISSDKNVKGKKAKIKWKSVSGASGYQLYMSTKKGSGYKRVYSGTKKSYAVKGLKKGKTYYFKVRTYKKATGCNAYSSYSGYKKVKIKK